MHQTREIPLESGQDRKSIGVYGGQSSIGVRGSPLKNRQISGQKALPARAPSLSAAGAGPQTVFALWLRGRCRYLSPATATTPRARTADGLAQLFLRHASKPPVADRRDRYRLRCCRADAPRAGSGAVSRAGSASNAPSHGAASHSRHGGCGRGQPHRRGADRGQSRHGSLEVAEARHAGRPDLRSPGDRRGCAHAPPLAEVHRRPSEVRPRQGGRGRDLPGGGTADAPLCEVHRQRKGHQPHAAEKSRDRRGRLDGSLRRRGGPSPHRVVLSREGLRHREGVDGRGQQAGRQGSRVPHRRGPQSQVALDQLRRQFDCQ